MRVNHSLRSDRVSNLRLCGAGKSPLLRPAGLILLLCAGGLAPLATSTAAKLAFVTSTSGSGILSTWPDAGGAAGLAAGDAICVARATAANLPEPQTFVAWLSDSNDDAYCRVHGLHGKKSANCGQSSLPTDAGPWQRTDGVAFLGSPGSPMSPVYSPLDRDEFRQVDNQSMVITGTNSGGDASTRNCGDWMAAVDVDFGQTYDTDPGWTHVAGYTFCNVAAPLHLACLQKGAGNPLPTPRNSHKQAFLTSSSFTGNLGAAAQAGGNTGVGAGDAICRNLAQAANLRDASSFKIYLADGADPATHFQYDGPWQRLDGVTFADGFAQIHTGYVNAPLNVTETGAYVSGLNQYAWTGITDTGAFAFQTCLEWTSKSVTGWVSLLDGIGPNWPPAYMSPGDCSGAQRLYCLSDSDELFRDGME